MDKLHSDLVDLLHNRYDLSKNYIRQSIRGTRNGKVSIRIAEEYKILKSHTNKAIKEAQKQIDKQL